MMSLAAGWTAPLFVPATRLERFEKAVASGTDLVIVDLEDAVELSAKQHARDQLVSYGSFRGSVLVRINSVGTPWHDDDLAAVRCLDGLGIMLPKAEDPAAVEAITRHLPGRPIVPLIESAAGLAAARELGKARQVAQLAFGSLDFALDIGCSHEQTALLLARSEIVLASKLCGIASPLDGVTADFRNMDTLREDALHACALGMQGKLCIHPQQVPAVIDHFRPSQEELKWAERVLVENNEGLSVIDGSMIDAPVRAKARKIIERHRKSTER